MSFEKMWSVRKTLAVRFAIWQSAVSAADRRTTRTWHEETAPGTETIHPTPGAVDAFYTMAADLELADWEVEVAWYAIFGRFYDPSFLGEPAPQ